MTKFKVIGYCSCQKCCGKSSKIPPISGVMPRANHTLAAPKTYKLGTRINLEGYGIYVVEDRGGAIRDNSIEIFFSSHQEVLKWGVKYINGSVLQ